MNEEEKLEVFIRLRFDELHNLIAKSQLFAKPLSDKSFYDSLTFMDNMMAEKRESIIKALREFNSKVSTWMGTTNLCLLARKRDLNVFSVNMNLLWYLKEIGIPAAMWNAFAQFHHSLNTRQIRSRIWKAKRNSMPGGLKKE
jgi:hypothetical protein